MSKKEIEENLNIISENDLPDNEKKVEESSNKKVLMEFKNVTKEYSRGDRVFYALKDHQHHDEEGLHRGTTLLRCYRQPLQTRAFAHHRLPYGADVCVEH